MTREELMQLAAEKAISEVSWDSIEFLFRPSTMFELLLRVDFEGTKSLVERWVCDDGPSAMPHRFRSVPLNIMRKHIEIEEFYRKLRELHESSTTTQLVDNPI